MEITCTVATCSEPDHPESNKIFFASRLAVTVVKPPFPFGLPNAQRNAWGRLRDRKAERVR